MVRISELFPLLQTNDVVMHIIPHFISGRCAASPGLPFPQQGHPNLELGQRHPGAAALIAHCRASAPGTNVVSNRSKL